MHTTKTIKTQDGAVYMQVWKGPIVRITPRRVKSDPDSHHNATRRRAKKRHHR